MAALREPHWSALTPAGPLRHWRLMEVGQQPAALLTTSSLKIDERILHFLAGIQYLDERLVGLVDQVPQAVISSRRMQELAQRVAAAWHQAQGRLPLIELCGADEPSQRSIAAAACAELGLAPWRMSADNHPGQRRASWRVCRACGNAKLCSHRCALYVEADTFDLADVTGRGRRLALAGAHQRRRSAQYA